MTHEQEILLIQMISEIYHHFGLDGQRPLCFTYLQKEAAKDILKWKSKKLKKGYERETPTR